VELLHRGSTAGLWCGDKGGAAQIQRDRRGSVSEGGRHRFYQLFEGGPPHRLSSWSAMMLAVSVHGGIHDDIDLAVP
jgi:hypothetical protein